MNKRLILYFIICAVATAILQSACLPQDIAQTRLQWETLNEPGSGGAMTGIIASPFDSKRLLVAGDMLGVGLSLDGGKSWAPTFGFKSWECADFSWHPSSPNIVWVGTMGGPYMSADGGKNWVQRRKGMPPPVGFGYSVPIEKVLFDPKNSSRLIAFGGSSRGWQSLGTPLWGAIWESINGGENWKKLTTITEKGSNDANDAKGVNVSSAAFAANSSEILYAASPGNGFFISRNGGKSWTSVASGLPHKNVQRIATHPTERDTVYVSLYCGEPGTDGLRAPGGIYKSVDAGKHWASVSNGLSQSRAKEDVFTARYKGLAISASNPDILMCSDEAWNSGAIYGTKDGGKSWRMLATKQNFGNETNDPKRAATSHPETAYPAGLGMGVIAIDPRNPDNAYACQTETILATRDGGRNWEDSTAYRPEKNAGWRGRGFSGLVTTGFRFHPTLKNRSALLGMDAGKIQVSTDGLNTWNFKVSSPSPWGGGNDVSFAGNRVYATFGQNGSFDGIGRSIDNGDSWQVLEGATHGLPALGSRNQPIGIYARADDPLKVWCCLGGKLYATENGGELWKVAFEAPGLEWIAGDPRDAKHFYAAGEKNVYATTDGVKFTNIGGPHKSGRITTDSLGRLYLCAGEGKRGGLWRYSHGKWERLSDEYWISSVAVDPTNPDRIAFSTNQNPYTEVSLATGVWISADAGKSWSQQNAGLPMTRGSALVFNPHDPEQLIFGTDGRGFFKTRWSKSYSPKGERAYIDNEEDWRFAHEE